MLKPPSNLLLGPSGTGKTSALATYAAAGIETFVTVTEPSGVDSLVDAAQRLGISLDLIHWTTVPPMPPDLDVFEDTIRVIANMGYEQISNIKTGVGKDKTREPADKLLESLRDFKCERTGQSYGSPFEWDDTRAYALDSLTGLNTIAMDLTIGFKPSAHQGEWGVAMNFEEKIILKLCADLWCHFTLTAHVDKEVNEITGAKQVMAAALGRKLAPRIARYFNEIIYCVKDKKSFTWSTIEDGVDLKNRALPLEAGLDPDFGQIVEMHTRRKEVAAGGKPKVLAIENSQTKPKRR